MITFRYQELSDGGVPRFPSYVRLNQGQTASAPTAVSSAAKPAAKPAATQSAATQPTAPATSSSGAAGTGGARYFEFVDGKSSKFWEISMDGMEVTVRYGRIGANGTTKTKEFPSEAAATAHYDKLVEEKTSKGYVEA